MSSVFQSPPRVALSPPSLLSLVQMPAELAAPLRSLNLSWTDKLVRKLRRLQITVSQKARQAPPVLPVLPEAPALVDLAAVVAQAPRAVSRTTTSIFHTLRHHTPAQQFGVLTAPATRTLFTSTRLNSTSQDQLEKLRDAADSEPQSASRQAALMEMLAKETPAEAVRRYESGSYAANEIVFKHYIMALIKMNRFWQARLVPPTSKSFSKNATSSTSSSTSSTSSTGSSGSSGYGLAGSVGSGSEDAPMHVVIKEPSGWSQMWRLVRWIFLMLLFMSALNQFVDERGIGGKGGGSGPNEIKPDTMSKRYTFEDVQGADEAKEELQDIVEFLRNPQKYTRLGGKLPRGVLLTGPPGTGKTLLARAVAGEAGVPFFYCSGSEFDEVFVGVGARRVRDLFAAAKRKSPCIIFLDEIDAVGGKRSAKDQQYVKMTLNQLLVDLDGFNQTDGIIVIGATNFPEMLDPALTRPGRFDTHINVSLPDLRGRFAILKGHAKGIPIENEDDLWKVARGTPGFSGAELANLINQASLKASRENHATIDLKTLEWAKDKILMGPERLKAAISDKDKKVTAYHEAGHALCALKAEGAVPVYKATIIPRGRALGMVTQLPEDDTNSVTRKEMMARMVVLMGGRAAETLVFGKDNVTSGASSDLQQATNLARAMVMKYGMSDKVGPIVISRDSSISGDIRKRVEEEILALLQEALDGATEILKKHDKAHKRIADALLERETLTAEEMRALIDNKPLPPIVLA